MKTKILVFDSDSQLVCMFRVIYKFLIDIFGLIITVDSHARELDIIGNQKWRFVTKNEIKKMKRLWRQHCIFKC